MHELNGLGLWPLLIWNLPGFKKKKVSAGNQQKNYNLYINTLGIH